MANKKKVCSGITKIQAVIITVIIVLAAIIGAWSYLFLSGPKGPEAILVGIVAPITGYGAQQGETVPCLVEYAENIVNNKWGGIYIKEAGKKVPIKFLIRDCQSDVALAKSLAEELITKDHIHFMLVPTGMEYQGVIAPVCESYQIPTLCHLNIGLNAHLLGELNWVYLTCHSGSAFQLGTIEHLRKLDRKYNTNKRIGILNPNNDFGQRNREQIGYWFDNTEFTIVDLGLYSLGIKDFTPYIEQLKAQKCDFCLTELWFEDGPIFWRQALELGYRPIAVKIGLAAVDPTGVAAIGGKLGHGITTTTVFSPNYPFRESLGGMTCQQLWNYYREKTGREGATNLLIMAGIEVVVDVFKRAGSIDKYEVKKALGDTSLYTCWGKVDFKAPYPSVLVPHLQKWEPGFIMYADHISLQPNIVAQWYYENGRWIPKITASVFPDIQPEIEPFSIPYEELGYGK
ncbi:MAG: ABC transporter substrate-binding protein [Candidatus Bathyarchaeia archaeon]